jgi:hypothetical protein
MTMAAAYLQPIKIKYSRLFSQLEEALEVRG